MEKGDPALFLTKQRLIPSTGYCCSAIHLGTRKFASVEVLVANTVKRVMPKSDSKFIDKFSQLLDPQATYCRQVSDSHVLYFKKHQTGSLEFWHEMIDLCSKPAIRSDIKSKSLFRDHNDSFKQNSSSVLELLSSGETFFTTKLPLNANTMVLCQINPPNILCSLWNQSSLIVKYFQTKALEGNKEEGDCKKANVTIGKPPSNFESYSIPWFGTIVIPQDEEEVKNEKLFSEKEICEKDKTSSMNHTCESTPEQPRGYASKLSDYADEDSVSNDHEDPSSKAIAQTMALISSGNKYALDDICHHMNIFRQYKRSLVPGRRFTLF